MYLGEVYMGRTEMSISVLKCSSVRRSEMK